MNSSNSLKEHETGVSFEEKIDILFHEIDLAIKWARPSILFAIYSSGSIRSKAKAELEDRLTHLNQKTHIVEISGKKQSNFSTDIFQLPQLSHSVLFIDDINCDCKEENAGFFRELKSNLERFIDHRIRVIFWLSVEDVPLFATNAIECWILRHRVVEFQDSPLQTNTLLQTLESTWQGLDENTFEDLTSSLAIDEILNSPEKVEPSFFHGNLILMLGVLNWRKGNSKDAQELLNAALDIAKQISHQKLETQCINALALIQSDPKNTDDPIIAPRQDIPLLSDLEDSVVKSRQLAMPSSDKEQSGEVEENKNINLEKQERGVDMKESDHIFDCKTSTEWNDMGNKFLRAGSYNDAINAFTKAIELAPDLNWPYIRNLASAHYHKGKIKGKSSFGKTEEPDVWEGDDDEMEPIACFNQENIPSAKRGDNDLEEEGNRKNETTGKLVEQKVVPSSPVSPSVDRQEDPMTSDANTQPVISSATDIPAGKQSSEQEIPSTYVEESIPLPPGFTAFSQAEDKGPQSAFDWNQLGNSHASTRDFDKAIDAYKKSIELDPRFGQPYSNLGSVLYYIGKYQSAVLLLQRSLDYLETPEDKALSWNRLGDVYRRMRDYGNALAAYQKASQLNPDTNPVLTRAHLSLMDSVAVG